MVELISLSDCPSSAPARIKSGLSEDRSRSQSQPGSEEERPGWLLPPPGPGDLRARPRSVTGHADHRPAVLPLYLVHHHQPARLAVHLPCKHHQLLHPQVCRTAVSNHNHHLSRRGSTATILHQPPQQTRDPEQQTSSCDPEENSIIITNLQPATTNFSIRIFVSQHLPPSLACVG